MEAGKKISFGFTKSKPSPVKRKTEVNNDVQFIDCIESNAIKIKGALPPEEKEELVIPVRSNKPVKENKDAKVVTSETQNPTMLESHGAETLETIAVREILQDSQKLKESSQSKVLTLQPGDAQSKFVSEEESTLEDYESVPVTDFGMAMLRGMGWKPDKGIGKKERRVDPVVPVLRPKGMGLGADKRKFSATSADEPEDLVLKKGSYVQILAGSHKNSFGEVQSFDEDAGRVIIKTALGGSNVSVNESMIKVVSKPEFQKSSRVLNLAQYEECKLREEKAETGRKSSQEDTYESKKHKKHSSSDTNGRKFSRD